MLSATALVFLSIVATPAHADEVWVFRDGAEVVYETDIGDTAVLTYDYRGSRVRLYVPGLPRALNDRGTFNGYWIEPDRASYCEAELTGPDGYTSTSWGRAVITFDSPTFPSGWVAALGRCFGETSGSIRADAVYDNQILTPR